MTRSGGLTRQLDLRTGRTVWGAYRAPRVPVEPLRRDARTGVLVVGMGVSGAMVAEALTAAGRRVMLIDRRGPMLGSTSATTALVQFEIDTPLTLLARSIGRERAVRAWRRSRLAVDNLRARIAALEIACRCAPRASLYLAGDLLDAAGPGGRGRGPAGGRDLCRLPRSSAELRERYGIAREGAIESRDNLALDPRKLTAGLLLRARRARSAAARAGGGDELRPLVDGRRGRDRGRAGDQRRARRARHRLRARRAGAGRGAPGHLDLGDGDAGGSRGGSGRGAAMIWEASDPYLYLRATHDGRVICGGEDEEFADEERRGRADRQQDRRDRRKLARLLPGIDATPAFAWAGSFGATATGLPIIRRLERRPRMHAVMGYGGNGITFSRIAAELIATELDGGEDADADLYKGSHLRG